jgi:hypothetical protein
LAPFGQAVSEEKIFLTLANQKKELILAAMFVGRMEPNEKAEPLVLVSCPKGQVKKYVNVEACKYFRVCF